MVLEGKWCRSSIDVFRAAVIPRNVTIGVRFARCIFCRCADAEVVHSHVAGLCVTPLPPPVKTPPGDADADSGADAAATDSADTEVEGAPAADPVAGTEENEDKAEGEGDAGDAKDGKDKKEKPKKKKKKKTIKVNKTKIVTDRKKAKLDVVPHFTVSSPRGCYLCHEHFVRRA